MKILIFSPAPSESTRGNQITALRWANLIRRLGHDVSIVDPTHIDAVDLFKFDLLVALHARHSFRAVKKFREHNPRKRIVVAVTGTDLYRDLLGDNSEPRSRSGNTSDTPLRSRSGNTSENPPRSRSGNTSENPQFPNSCESGYRRIPDLKCALGNSARVDDVVRCLEMASEIITLEPESRNLLPTGFQKKTTVIFQSAQPVEQSLVKRSETEFVVTLIGHLRSVKDPFLTAEALRYLPSNSRIKVIHLGEALDEDMKTTALRKAADNPRYQWRGPVSHHDAQLQLAASQLTVLSSRMEGAPSVISEAVVNEVPILATRIHAAIGLLGNDYPGLFPVGDAKRLANLLSLAESNREFYQTLRSTVIDLKPKFDPRREQQAWQELLENGLSQ